MIRLIPRASLGSTRLGGPKNRLGLAAVLGGGGVKAIRREGDGGLNDDIGRRAARRKARKRTRPARPQAARRMRLPLPTKFQAQLTGDEGGDEGFGVGA